MFDIKKWLEKEGFDFEFVNERNVSWPCPWCNKGKGHFTVSITEKEVFNCYHCNAAGDYVELIMKLKGISYKDAYDIVNDFFMEVQTFEPKEEPKHESVGISLPSRSSWTARTRQYMESRGWSRAEMDYFGLYPTSEWPYKGRIVLPVYEEGNPVFFQARTTVDAKPKYRSPKGSEKSFWLWNIDSIEDRTVVLAEGVFSAFNILKAGYSSVAVFGKTVSAIQAKKLLTKGIKEIFIFFDPDTVFLKFKGGFHLDILSMKLSRIFPKVWFVETENGDPGDMSLPSIKKAMENPCSTFHELMTRSE